MQRYVELEVPEEFDPEEHTVFDAIEGGGAIVTDPSVVSRAELEDLLREFLDTFDSPYKSNLWYRVKSTIDTIDKE